MGESIQGGLGSRSVTKADQNYALDQVMRQGTDLEVVRSEIREISGWDIARSRVVRWHPRHQVMRPR